MPVIRTFHCDNCEQEFEIVQNMNDEAPDCPTCVRVLQWQPKSFAITGTKSRAMDVTQEILETDFGLTDFNDNMREGDVAAKIAPEPTTVQREAGIRSLSEAAQSLGTPMSAEQQNMAKNFWGGSAITQAVPAAVMLGNAKLATAAATAEGVNPMELLHKGGKQGRLKTPVHVVARG